MNACASIRACATSLVLAACATTPAGSPVAEGDDVLVVSAYEFTGYPDELTAKLEGADRPVETPGVVCTLGNDKGSWTVTTPATVKVARSSVPLQVECTKEGFKTQRRALACLTPKQREAPGTLPISLLALTGGIVTFPFGTDLIFQGALGLGESMYTSSRPNVCTYGPISIALSK